MKYWKIILAVGEEPSEQFFGFFFFVLWAPTPQRSLFSQIFYLLDRKFSILKKKIEKKEKKKGKR